MLLRALLDSPTSGPDVQRRCRLCRRRLLGLQGFFLRFATGAFSAYPDRRWRNRNGVGGSHHLVGDAVSLMLERVVGLTDRSTFAVLRSAPTAQSRALQVYTTRSAAISGFLQNPKMRSVLLPGCSGRDDAGLVPRR